MDEFEKFEKQMRYIKLVYPIGIVVISFMVYWQYQEQNYISAMFQCFCLGSLLTSWIFTKFQQKANKYKTLTYNIDEKLEKGDFVRITGKSVSVINNHDK